MSHTLALTIDGSDPATYGYGVGGVGILWFLAANRVKLLEIGKQLMSLFALWKSQPKLPVATPAPPEMVAAQAEQEAAFKEQLNAVRSLNKAELDLIANGHFEGLSSVEAARKALPLKMNGPSDDDGLIDSLYFCSRAFREKSNKAGLDAVIAAYKALPPATQTVGK